MHMPQVSVHLPELVMGKISVSATDAEGPSVYHRSDKESANDATGYTAHLDKKRGANFKMLLYDDQG